jgi:DNA-binding NtrC family response regulator
MPKRRYILIVEDESIVRLNAREMFEDAGFEVLEAENADTALHLLERHGSELAALFTDVHMPGSLDGMDLARAVHERWPHIIPLVTSGRLRLSDSDVPDSGRFVLKPYRMAEVVGTVRNALG